MTADEQATRTLEKIVEIDAPAEAVWEALTDPDELARWFPLEARVEPGAGGSIWMAWGEYWQGTNRIEIWEPGRHLRTTWPVGGHADAATTSDSEERFEVPEAADRGPSELTVDYFIESEGGKTRLRLVHSGFGKGALWDDWFDGVRRGWDYELESLRHYLELHRGTNRSVLWSRYSIERRGDDAIDALFGEDGLFSDGSIEGLAPGDPYSLVAFDDFILQGIVQVNEPGAQFAATVEGMNDGLFRIESFCHGKKQDISLFLAAWGVPEDRMQGLSERWQRRLMEVYETP